MDSKKKPIWLEFKNKDGSQIMIIMILSTGQLTLQKLTDKFERLWLEFIENTPGKLKLIKTIIHSLYICLLSQIYIKQSTSAVWCEFASLSVPSSCCQCSHSLER